MTKPNQDAIGMLPFKQSTVSLQVQEHYKTPMLLLGYQQRWCADLTPVKVCEKSRRIGLSWGEAADSALFAASQKGMDTWYIGYNKDMAQEFIRDCADWAKAYGLAAGEIEETEEIFKEGDEEKAILAYVIRFSSGWRITALSSRPSNLRGKQGRVIIDEAAFHDDLPELLKAAMALLMWGGQVHIISTHNGVDNPFNELVNEVRAGKKPYSLHTITFDDAIKDGLYQRICLRLGRTWSQQAQDEWVAEIRASYGDAAAEELDCIPRNSGGAWLTRALIESRMNADTPRLCLEKKDEFALQPEPIRNREIAQWCDENLYPVLTALPEKQRHFLGMDFARSGDLSVIAIGQEQSDLCLKNVLLLELSNIPFAQQEQIYFYIGDRLPRFSKAANDARGNGQSLSEKAFDRYGAIVEGVMLSESWYREHTAPFKAALEDDTLFDIVKNDDVLADLRAFQVVKGIPRLPDKRTVGQNKTKRHGDAAIAYLLLHYAYRTDQSFEINFRSTGTRTTTQLFNNNSFERVRAGRGFGSIRGGNGFRGY
ncbi:Mu-like prophage FluMu protein gp28 [[Haemophilus] ducreyi]|uniref:terminase large subunit domain-containing protein n=1 Tax=Haemophilus ducreyi TaxID=730 RepID=UPI000655A26E|nr:terminase family protein [[Haemophilus] ducreyi]AKO37029.1 Mu-like prophage FluMu protein gp28 [[Haemophilus] ducreyi]AKO38504.1 Mu-like prophage FluMu protein gp28 [[Haemophilus] ducreyi]AKO41516.1 Mu-like prophage FluMu protein gp28 [[Haemophilus] ducreyi]AKO42950.1 Mu-like prophage FluMu protein gp28 [[Haemophilus] ducreyi]